MQEVSRFGVAQDVETFVEVVEPLQIHGFTKIGMKDAGRGQGNLADNSLRKVNGRRLDGGEAQRGILSTNQGGRSSCSVRRRGVFVLAYLK